MEAWEKKDSGNPSVKTYGFDSSLCTREPLGKRIACFKTDYGL